MASSTTQPITITDSSVLGVLKEIAEENGLGDYKIEHAEAVGKFVGKNKGEGYLGEITLVQISGKDGRSRSGGGKRKTLDLVIKCAAKSENLRKQTPISDVYDREICMYNDVLPLFRRFESDRNIAEPFSGYPKCFKTSMVDGNEMLIFENLNSKGYRVWDRRLQLTPDHVRLVFIALGHFHAISLAMRDQQPQVFQKHTKGFFDMFLKFVCSYGFLNTVVHRLGKARSALDPKTNPVAVEKLEKFYAGLEGFFKEIQESVDEYSVVLHGDNWVTNMLFKYGAALEPSKPTEVALVDFQLSRLGSPVLDLAYFVYVSAPKPVLDNLNDYLVIYYESLSTNLIQLGSDPSKVYPFGVLQQHWGKYARFALTVGSVIIHAMLSDADEAVDFAEVADSGKDVSASFDYEIKEQAEYERRMRDMFLHFSENNFI